MSALPLQVLDNFLLQYNVGQVLLLVFVLAVLGSLPLRSRKLVAAQFVGFGLVFMLTPQSLMEDFYWKFLGIVLLVLGPVLFVTARR